MAKTIVLAILTSTITAGIIVFILKLYIKSLFKIYSDKEIIEYKSNVNISSEIKKQLNSERQIALKESLSIVYKERNKLREIVEILQFNLLEGHNNESKASKFIMNKIKYYKPLPNIPFFRFRKPEDSKYYEGNVNIDFLQILYEHRAVLPNDVFNIVHDIKSQLLSSYACIVTILDLIHDKKNENIDMKRKYLHSLVASFNKIDHLYKELVITIKRFIPLD